MDPPPPPWRPPYILRSRLDPTHFRIRINPVGRNTSYAPWLPNVNSSRARAEAAKKAAEAAQLQPPGSVASAAGAGYQNLYANAPSTSGSLSGIVASASGAGYPDLYANAPSTSGSLPGIVASVAGAGLQNFYANAPSTSGALPGMVASEPCVGNRMDGFDAAKPVSDHGNAMSVPSVGYKMDAVKSEPVHGNAMSVPSVGNKMDAVKSEESVHGNAMSEPCVSNKKNQDGASGGTPIRPEPVQSAPELSTSPLTPRERLDYLARKERNEAYGYVTPELQSPRKVYSFCINDEEDPNKVEEVIRTYCTSLSEAEIKNYLELHKFYIESKQTQRERDGNIWFQKNPIELIKQRHNINMSGAGGAQQVQAAGGGSAPSAPQLFRGIVKQVLSGDSIIIRGQPKGGPPPERQLSFSNITAPRLARRPGGPNAKPDDGKDEPWAWESREHVRKKLIGKEVVFVVEYKVTSGREYGTVFLGKDAETGENITEEIVREGLASVRKEGKSDVARLVELEDKAKSEAKGRWGPDPEKHVRDIVWQIDNPRQLLEKFGRKPVQAVVEHVRDGSTIRVFLLPSFHYVTLMMSGIRCPGVKLDAEGKPDLASREPFSEEAKFFTESRLLQRDVEIIVESVNNQNLVGSIIHPNGNIAELLLKDGFARCIDWSMGFVTGGAERLRAAEKAAREKKLRIWKDYQASASTNAAAGLKAKDKEFVATVAECVNGDALVVRKADGTLCKIFLASTRPPRPAEDKEGEGKEKGKPTRPLYDIPYMFEAREYLRKKLITKKVNVTVDYIQPASQTFPEKICCTVKIDGANVAEALISKGYATVVRYRQDDDQRASEYDALLAAEARAQKIAKGVWGKEQPAHHVVDLSGDAAKAKQFLPYLQRAGKISALVEYVASGSRLRLYVPRETRLITFLLAGISCPRAGRAGGPGGPPMEGEPFGEEALLFTKEQCHQREVEIEVDSIDKAGNFIGFLWIDNKNLSVQLVEEGLSTVHFSAERTPYFRPLQIAEENAKARREKIWRDFVDAKEEIKPEDDKVERKVDPKPVLVTEVTNELHVYVQFTDDGDKLETLMSDIRRELGDKPPLTGAYTPKKGDLCVARYSGDGEWYRARVEKILPDGEVAVVFFDYGNRENVKAAKCAALPPIAASGLAPFAKEYALACVSLPSDEEFANEAVHAVRHDTSDGVFLLNVEYKVGGLEYVTLADKTSKEDLAQKLVKEGLLLVENKKERRLQKLLKDYKAAETEAKTKHLCIWQYGDITEDDAREFGMGRN